MKHMQTSLGSKPLTSGGLHDLKAIGLQNVTWTIQPVGPHTIQPAGLLSFLFFVWAEQRRARAHYFLTFLGKKNFFLIELKCAAIKWFHLWTKPEFCFGIGRSTIINLKCQKWGFLLQSKLYHRTMNFATRIIQICCGIMNCYIHNANILWNKELRLLEQYKI